MMYLKSDRRDGVRLPDETVDADYVQRMVGPETRAFFEAFGGKEEHRRIAGRYYMKATSGDGKHVREVVFTPIYPTQP